MEATSPLIPPGNQIFLHIPETMQDYIEVGGEEKLRLYTAAYNTEDHCATRARVAAIGPDCTLPVKVGDYVAISYLVVASGRNNPAGYREYDRALQYKGEIFWRAFENDLIAHITPVGYEALGDYVVMSQPLPVVSKEMLHMQAAGLIHSAGLKGYVPKNCGTYQSGNLEDVRIGDLLYFDERYCGKYDMPDKTKLWFIGRDFIDGMAEDPQALAVGVVNDGISPAIAFQMQQAR